MSHVGISVGGGEGDRLRHVILTFWLTKSRGKLMILDSIGSSVAAVACIFFWRLSANSQRLLRI